MCVTLCHPNEAGIRMAQQVRCILERIHRVVLLVGLMELRDGASVAQITACKAVIGCSVLGDREWDEMHAELARIRLEITASLCAASMESYSRAYPHLVHLHMLQVSSAKEGCRVFYCVLRLSHTASCLSFAGTGG